MLRDAPTEYSRPKFLVDGTVYCVMVQKRSRGSGLPAVGIPIQIGEIGMRSGLLDSLN